MKIIRKLLTLICFCFALKTGAQIKWPAITQQTKPWSRWWWEGSAVDKKNLTSNLEDYKAAGLGGLEVTPIYGIYGYENKFINFLSPQWMDMFDHTLKESKRLGIGIDMANGTGWPFGGPEVTDRYASKTIVYKNYQLNSGDELKEPVVYHQQGFVRTANNKQVAVDQLKPVIAENKDLQSLALDQVKFTTDLPLQILMAYNNNGQVLNLTKNVDQNRKLNWKAPAGKWNLYALFQGLHGKMVERAAPGGEGYAIDHFSADAVKNYFKKFDNAFKGHDVSYIRALFNDSYEVDDARGQSNWTPDFLSQFKKRKGYNLEDHLPALFQKDSPEMNSRVIYDYRSVIGELILENFTIAWKNWGHSKGAVIRNQSHGSPANLLDLYGAIDIPETEGTDILRFKFATSAAHVTGKELASSESATWLNEHFLSSWGDVKKALDLYFLGGVNHIFYHGVAYSPKEEAWPGWLFYAAVHFQQTNPQWKDFHALNEYVARVQSFLQQGKPDNDVLVYYPLDDRYADAGRDLLQHFDGMGREFEGTDFKNVSEWMLNNGYSYDFFSDRQLQNINITNGHLQSGGNNYQTILLPANKYISEKSFQKLVELAKAGAQILVYKNLPQDIPGLSNLENRKKTFQQLLSQLHFASSNNIQKAIIGKGVFLISSDVNTLLEAAHVRRESMVKNELQFTRRINSDGYTYFVNNRTAKAFSGWLPLQLNASSVALFDPIIVKSGLAKFRKSGNGTEVFVTLDPSASLIIQTFNTNKTGSKFPYMQPAGTSQPVNGNWTVQFISGGPVLPKTQSTNKLGSWTEFEGEDVKNFSGTAKYSTVFSKPADASSGWLLDLGKLNETAEVILNGEKLGTLIGPNFQLVIPSSKLKQTNTLEVLVSNLMANRISYMDRNNIQWKKFYNTNMPARRAENTKNGLFDASKWKPLPSGLSGPVTLTAIKFEE